MNDPILHEAVRADADAQAARERERAAALRGRYATQAAATGTRDGTDAGGEDEEDDGPRIGLVDLLTWLGEGKRTIALAAALTAVASIAVALLLPPVFTARTTLLPPGSQQQSSSAAALAALGSLGSLGSGLAMKTPDELYVALLKSDTVQRSLVEPFKLKERWDAETFEQLRRMFPKFVRVSADKKSGVIGVEVDDKDPRFAADLANAHAREVTRLLGRLAVSEAQLRRVFFGQQLEETKERLVQAEQRLREVQEKSGVIVLDKQAEALIGSAAEIRARIAEREVMLKVLRSSATERNPDVQRLVSELRALRAELARMEASPAAAASAPEGSPVGSPVDIPVTRIPGAAVDYVRARRELKLQETLLESMVRQYEVAKLDEAKEGPILQQIDVALPPDRKSKPARSLIVLGSVVAAIVLASVFVIWRRWSALRRALDPRADEAWRRLRGAWGWRKRA